jgi:hypothetical protein
MSTVLVTAYIVSAALQTVGIAFVIGEWRADRRRSESLAMGPVSVYGGARIRLAGHERSAIRRGGEEATRSLDTRLASVERQLGAVLSNYQRGDEHLTRVLEEQLSRGFVDRVKAPGLLICGVLIGAAANVAAVCS